MKTPYIGFWKRAVAFILDSLLCSLPPAVICLPLLIWLFTKMIQGTPTPTQIVLSFGLYLLWMLLAILCYWLYFAYFESGAKQATLGKQLMGIKVIGKDGNRITFARATGRLFAKWISYMLLNFGFIMAGMTSKKRALHDYIAETYVVRADFQPGDELPDTPSHPYWMVFTAVVLVLSMLGMVLFNLVFAAAVLDRAPAAVARRASTTLQEFAATKKSLSEEGLENSGVWYGQDEDGYYANFTDMADNEYTLALPTGSTEVCCVSKASDQCADTGLPVCK